MNSKEMEGMDSKEIAQKYFDDMRTITMDTNDARDCAIIMVKELKTFTPFMSDYWDEVLEELKTTTKRLKVKK